MLAVRDRLLRDRRRQDGETDEDLEEHERSHFTVTPGRREKEQIGEGTLEKRERERARE